MNDEEIAQLQNDDEWDFESAVRQRSPRSHRAVVSVGFKTADFTLVAEAARKRDQPLSQFIREAALDRAREREKVTIVHETVTIKMSETPKHLDIVLAEAMKYQGRLAAMR